MTPADIAVIAERTDHVAGPRADARRLRGPEPVHGARGRGGHAGLRARALRRPASSPGSRSRSPGSATSARRSRGASPTRARLVVSDIDAGKRAARRRARRTWVEPERRAARRVRHPRPCALGGAIDAATSRVLRCEVVCGCANNQLADDGLAERAARARDPLRARLHRQRRRAHPRLPRDPRLLRGGGDGARARDRGRARPGLRPRPGECGSRRSPPPSGSPRRASSAALVPD